jgi:hypothetical protein
MRRVLVDNHQPVAGLRDDISLVQLRASGAERLVEEIERREYGDSEIVIARLAPPE